jgi:hypothetical protein
MDLSLTKSSYNAGHAKTPAGIYYPERLFFITLEYYMKP